MQVKEQQRCNGPEVEVRSAKLSNGKEATERAKQRTGEGGADRPCRPL